MGAKDLPDHSGRSWKQRQASEGQGWEVLGDLGEEPLGWRGQILCLHYIV